MKRPPEPRPGIYETYWHFASERQRAFERRVAGEPGPWTNDPILQRYKFCNVFRAADRVSQYLIRHVAYAKEASEPSDRLFQILAFRFFSRMETWESVRTFLGRAPVISDLVSGDFLRALDAAKKENGGLYTSAFILCAANPYKQPDKHRNHVELFRHMFVKDRVGEHLLRARSLQEIFLRLREYPLIGDFMAYQIAVDLNYSALVNFSENDFTQPGPGAIRGLKKVFVHLGDYSPAETILWMGERQTQEFARLSLPWNGLWGRGIHAIDAQGLFCEVDKYCREAAPELVSGRTRIKAKFAPSTDPLKLFFPPKWGLNQKLPH